MAGGSPVLADDLADRRTADAVRLCRVGQAESTVAITKDSNAIDVQRAPADVASFESGAAQASSNSLDDQRPFQLGDSGHYYYDRAAQRAGGVVDLLAETDEADAEVVQLGEYFDEVLHAAGQAVGGPHDHDVEPAAPQRNLGAPPAVTNSAARIPVGIASVRLQRK